MTLRINNNTAAMIALMSASRNEGQTSSSLEKLSSGQRINKAADDASGMTIADSLRSQALGLGQAIKNANDAISVVQIADGALDEAINIINMVKTKSIQAGQDGQNTESRRSIQADIAKLLTELDIIATTTSFNSQSLLSGAFSNKSFQVGSYAQEIVNVSIPSAQSNKLGHVVNSRLSLVGQKPGMVEISIAGNQTEKEFVITPTMVAYDNTRAHSMAALADGINILSDQLGTRANAVVESSTGLPVQSGTTDYDFTINGVNIGQLQVNDNDEDGALVKAINRHSANHGVRASIGKGGRLTLTSIDGRAIQVTSGLGSGTGTDKVLQGADLTTLGFVQLQQIGVGDLKVTDLSGGDVVALSTDLKTAGRSTTVTDSVLAAGSVLSKGSVLQSGWLAGQDLPGEFLAEEIEIVTATLMMQNSLLGIGSKVVTEDVLGGDALVENASSTKLESNLKSGSLLRANSVLGVGTVLDPGRTIPSGTAFKGDARIMTTSPTTAISTVKANSILNTGSIFSPASILGGNGIIEQVAPLTGPATIKGGSTLRANSIFAAATVLPDNFTINAIAPTTGDSILTATSSLAAGSILVNGSTIGAGTVLTGDATVGAVASTAGNSTLVATSILTAGSSLATGSTIGAGTVLTGNATVAAIPVTAGNSTLTANSILVAGSVLAIGSTIGAGTVLTGNATVAAIASTTNNSTIANGSTLAGGSILAVNTVIPAGQTFNITVGGPLVGPTTVLAPVTLSGAQNITVPAGVVFQPGSRIENNSVLMTGSHVDGDALTLNAPLTLGAPMTLQGADAVLTATSNIAANSTLASGSHVDGDPLLLNAGLNLAGAMTLQGADAVLTATSNIAASSTLASGSHVDGDPLTLTGALNVTAPMLLLGGDSTLLAGSSIAGGTTLATGSHLDGDPLTLSVDYLVSADMIMAVGSEISANSILAAGSHVDGDQVILAADMNVVGDMTLQTGSVISQNSLIAYASILGIDATLLTSMTLQEIMVLGSDMLLDGDMSIASGSFFSDGSLLKRGSLLGNASFTLQDTMHVEDSMTLLAGSVIADQPATLIAAGTQVGGRAELAKDLNLNQDFALGAGSIIAENTLITNGSTLGGHVTLAEDEVVAQETDLYLAAGSSLAVGSLITKGTFLTNLIVDLNGVSYPVGILLEEDIVVGKEVPVNVDMTLQNGSILTAGSVLGGNLGRDVASSQLEGTRSHRLSQLNVLSQQDAQIAMSLADAALLDLEKIRSDLGSVQNQLESTIANISTTMVNVFTSESGIRDVDLAGESMVFARMQILNEAGTFAIVQANKSAENLLSLVA